MDNNEKSIYEFVNKYLDTLIVETDKVLILRGYSKDEDDFYWMLQNMHGEYIEYSCVGRLIPLKGFIPDDDYNALRDVYQLNLDIISRKIK